MSKNNLSSNSETSGNMKEEFSIMASTHLDLGEELGALVAELGQPVEQAARELIVLELYRRGVISSGKAAALLGVARLSFIQRASELGTPYFRFTDEEWREEVAETAHPGRAACSAARRLLRSASDWNHRYSPGSQDR